MLCFMRYRSRSLELSIVVANSNNSLPFGLAFLTVLLIPSHSGRVDSLITTSRLLWRVIKQYRKTVSLLLSSTRSTVANLKCISNISNSLEDIRIIDSMFSFVRTIWRDVPENEVNKSISSDENEKERRRQGEKSKKKRNMAATDAQIVLAAARWNEESQYLKDFVAKNKLPIAVKFVKGQYAGMGAPTLPNPGLTSTAILTSVGKRKKILAQAIKLKDDRRRMTGIGPKFIIPDTYHGYFELLSEEGRAMKCIESVADLTKRRLENGCLVRESVRGIVGKYDADGSLTADGARIVNSGEILFPEMEVQLGNSKGKFLRCLDASRDIVLLGIDQKGKFSALAKADNISGVHTAKTLVNKRLPISVRLIHGIPPRGLKNMNQFATEIRLLSIFEEEHVFALPLHRDANSVVALPLATQLKLQKVRNEEQLNDLREYQKILERCCRLVDEAVDKAYVLDGKMNDLKCLKVSSNGNANSRSGCFLKRSVSSDAAASTHYRNSAGMFGGIGVTSSHTKTKNSIEEEYDEIDQIYDYVRGFAPLPKNIRSPFPESKPSSTPSPVICNSASKRSDTSSYDHRYMNENFIPGGVVGGFTIDSANVASCAENVFSVSPAAPPDVNTKPEPPPIETIPTKKLPVVATQSNPQTKAEKRTRYPPVDADVGNLPVVTRTYTEAVNSGGNATCPVSNGVAKLYVKNGHSQNRRLLRQKSSSPPKEHQPLTKAGSPIFNMRYKSLSNLQQAMELDGTLDSSQSGGRTSGDSGAGAKLPEKRFRRLSRPRSLTNLVWDIRNEMELCAGEITLKPVKLESAIVCKKLYSQHKVAPAAQKRVGTLYL